jgi:hypothetical protein
MPPENKEGKTGEREKREITGEQERENKPRWVSPLLPFSC